jgi:hypothetical protein
MPRGRSDRNNGAFVYQRTPVRGTHPLAYPKRFLNFKKRFLNVS